MTFFDALRRLFGRANGQNGADTSAADTSAGEMISCDEAAARLFEFLDGELESASEDEVRRHLHVCERCYPRVQFEKHFLEALGRSQTNGRASEDLRNRVVRALAEEGGTGG